LISPQLSTPPQLRKALVAACSFAEPVTVLVVFLYCVKGNSNF
jgi:hypothetical protein